MLITAILSGDEETIEKTYQSKALIMAANELSIMNKPITILLDNGQKIMISKVLEGGDPTTRMLTVAII